MARLLADAGIVRHRGKVEAAIANARVVLDIWDGGETLGGIVASHAPTPEARPAVIDPATLLALDKTPESTALAKDLKRRGWRFLGPTTAYAAMQAVGVVNDHLEGCWVRPLAGRPAGCG